jgi:homopolymeric O-antigen transport system permease protein
MTTPGADQRHLVVEIVPGLQEIPSPLAMPRRLVANRYLLWQLSLREFLGAFKGSFLGALWSFVYPLLLLVVYAFIFSKVFRMRWGLEIPEGLGSFALVLFGGFIPFNLFSTVVQRSTGVIVGNTNLVSKVVFPLELLPTSVVLSGLFQAAVATVILLVAEILMLHRIPWTVFLALPVLVDLLLLTGGLAFILAALGVFVRDVASLITIVMQMMFFLTPITYPIEAVPEAYRTIFLLNPLTPIVIDWRNAILTGAPLHWRWIAAEFVFAALVFLLGHYLFHRTQRAFVEVL